MVDLQNGFASSGLLRGSLSDWDNYLSPEIILEVSHVPSGNLT